MFETILDEEERGQVGIGTLIVFIAMVLVAAIAAGVLINTAGFLQTQAEATGQESTSQVSDRLQVVSQSGSFNDAEGVIESVDFVVAQSPGSDNIDLSETSVEILGGDGQETFTLSSDFNDDGSQINIFTGSPGDVVLTDTSDRAEVTLNLDDSSGEISHIVGNDGYLVEEGDSLTVTFTTPSGATTTTELRVPSTVVRDSVRL
ncbi:flagellin FlaB [Halorubrum aquaticum]|uniref:Flagellin n=1 Tax=Halorubrum aquaticum TaxID=387340 RepID=A0A1I2ZTB9_9EURY|nr:archaellin/type IV pilin N-terminal domain-containing protein [Halorubrum aquaticum]SFH40749.1 flagellin FlaB [Halorubrum aquaticum]